MLRNKGTRAIAVRHVLNQKKLKSFLVPFLTTMGVMAPLENDPILSGRSIQSFRHLGLLNPSTIADFRYRYEKSEEEEEEEGEDPIIIEEDK